jgi:two-component system, NtrC family, sensor kinase
MDRNIYSFSTKEFSNNSSEVLFAPKVNSDEELFFADEVADDTETESWKILIVDDEVQVHTATDIALRKFVFENKSLKLLSAHSASEAQDLMKEHPDIAIILLDVIMETDDAGLRFVKYVREELGTRELVSANYFTHGSTRTSTRKKHYYQL